MYLNIFEDWASVQRNFETEEPEPEEVLFADYDYESYSGYATVVYRNGDRYFINTGSHCSCYGLEGQWGPEEYDRDTLIAYCERIVAGREYASSDVVKHYTQLLNNLKGTADGEDAED